MSARRDEEACMCVCEKIERRVLYMGAASYQVDMHSPLSFLAVRIAQLSIGNRYILFVTWANCELANTTFLYFFVNILQRIYDDAVKQTKALNYL